MEWKDTTSYSQHDKERIPRIWKIKSKNIIVTVHRHIHYDPDIWLLSCHPIYNCDKLKNKDLKLAQNEALELVKDYIEKQLHEINLMIEETKNETRN